MNSRSKISKFFLTALCLVAVSMLTVSCSRRKDIVFDDSDPYATATDISWAVITSRYVSYRTEPGYDKEISGHGRIGDVLMVKGKRYGKEGRRQIFWYEFDEGWIEESSLVVFDNKFKAMTQAKKLLEE